MDQKIALSETTSCPPKATLQERPHLTQEHATQLATIFRVLANDTRLRLLHALARSGELCVSEQCKLLAMKPQAVSNQLQRLVDRGVLSSRRNGNNIYYRVADPCVTELLEKGLCLMEEAQARLAGQKASQR